MADGSGPAEPDDVREPLRWRAVVRDLVLVAAWVAVVSVAFGVLRWPTWAYYLVALGGVLAYSLLGDPWAPTR